MNTTPDIGLFVGAIVTANFTGMGLPYQATVEAIKGERVKVRPLHATLTAGSARRYKTRKGDSLRARWVSVWTLKPALCAQ